MPRTSRVHAVVKLVTSFKQWLKCLRKGRWTGVVSISVVLITMNVTFTCTLRLVMYAVYVVGIRNIKLIIQLNSNFRIYFCRDSGFKATFSEIKGGNQTITFYLHCKSKQTFRLPANLFWQWIKLLLCVWDCWKPSNVEGYSLCNIPSLIPRIADKSISGG